MSENKMKFTEEEKSEFKKLFPNAMKLSHSLFKFRNLSKDTKRWLLPY